MSTTSALAAMISMNLKSLPQRLGTSSIVVMGTACVVAVLISVLAIADGLATAFAAAGHPDRAIVLRQGSTVEGTSFISKAESLTIAHAPGVKVASGGEPIAAAEVLLSATLPTDLDSEQRAISLRGLATASSSVRPEVAIVAGRTFRRGLHELIIGRAAQQEFSGLTVGNRIALKGSQWTIVGVFESGGDAHESEFMADVDTLLSAFRRNYYSSVTVLLESPAAFDAFKAAVTNNPALAVEVLREPEYYEKQSETAVKLLYLVTHVVTAIMAVGALFGSLNVMYSAINARATEIATLRAIGFGATGVVISVMTESLILAISGGLLGAALAWLLFNGNSMSMTPAASSTDQVVFHLRIGARLIATGFIWACVVGFAGGLLPAIRATRMQVTTALHPA